MCHGYRLFEIFTQSDNHINNSERVGWKDLYGAVLEVLLMNPFNQPRIASRPEDAHAFLIFVDSLLRMLEDLRTASDTDSSSSEAETTQLLLKDIRSKVGCIEQQTGKIENITERIEQQTGNIENILQNALPEIQAFINNQREQLQKNQITDDEFAESLANKIQNQLKYIDFQDTESNLLREFPDLRSDLSKLFQNPQPVKYKSFLLTAEYLYREYLLKTIEIDGAVIIIEYSKVVESILQERIGEPYYKAKKGKQKFDLGEWLYELQKKTYQDWVEKVYKSNDQELYNFLTPTKFKLTEESFDNLKTKLSPNAFKNLQSLKECEFITQELFLEAVKQQFGETDTSKYKKQIIAHGTIADLTFFTEQIRIFRNKAAHKDVCGKEEVKKVRHLLLEQHDPDHNKTYMQWLLKLLK